MKSESFMYSGFMASFECLVASVSDLAEKKKYQSQSNFFGSLALVTIYFPKKLED